MTAVLVGASALVMTPMSPWRILVLTGLAAASVHVPALAVSVAAAAMGASGVRRIRGRTRCRRAALEHLAALADLTAIGLSGGLGIQAALTVAGQSLGGAIGDEIRALLRRARVIGLAAALSSAAGVGQDLYRVVGRAAATGSALLAPVARIAAESNAELAAAQLRAVRRLPVSMLFPLTLLILPGFLLLTVAPALLDAFGRLEI